MLSNYLPDKISSAVNKIPYDILCELRLRADSEIIVNVSGENYYLCSDSLSKSSSNALSISRGAIVGIIQKISNNSMYTINDQLIEGYATIPGGIRVGVCGEVVTVNDRIKTLKNISSINFRFPHLVRNCSLKLYNYIVTNGEIKNTLIISPPGAGKTTYLRDIIYQLSTREKLFNILVIDERGELTKVIDKDNIIDIKNVDIYSNSTKKFGFNNGIRSMKPDVIITDEINLDRDMVDIENALTCGVNIITSIHASSIYDLKNKSSFRDILNKKLFDRYIVLSNNNGLGTIEGVYNESLNFMGV